LKGGQFYINTSKSNLISDLHHKHQSKGSFIQCKYPIGCVVSDKKVFENFSQWEIFVWFLLAMLNFQLAQKSQI